MLLNVVTTAALTIMFVCLNASVLRADDCKLDETSFGARSQNVCEDEKEASNVLAENQDETFDEEDYKPNTEHLYSLDDDEDDFD